MSKKKKKKGIDLITLMLVVIAALFSALIFLSGHNRTQEIELVLIVLGVLVGFTILLVIIAQTGKRKKPHSVYLLYASEDTPFVAKLYEAMKITPYKMLWDKKEIQVGDHIEKKTEQLLAHCDDVVFVVSRHSSPPEWSEPMLSKAMKLRKRILPVLIDNSELPEALKEIMFADFRESFDDGYFSLRDALKAERKVERRPRAARATPE